MSVSTFKEGSQDWLTDVRTRLVVACAAFTALLVSLLGPGWLFAPGNPAAKMPETTLSFGDLHDLAHSGAVPTTTLQQSYFGWLGWSLVLATGITAVLVAVVGRRVPVALLALLSVAGLVVTTFGLKGALTWADFLDQVPNVRVGGYLVFVGYMSVLVFVALVAKGARTSRT